MASEITVYNSQGYEYDESGKTNRQDEYIRELIFANVRFIADTAGDTEFVTFFRGRESMAGRSEMFYARYVTTGTPDLEAFSRELESYVEDDLGLVMDATAEGVIYDRIGTDMRDLVTVDADDGLIGELLRGGDQLQFGVPDHDVAIGVLQRYISAADTIAICESADASVLSDIDIVVEVGSYAGTEPLGNTGQLIQEAKKRREAARQPQGGGAGGGGHHAQHGLSRQQPSQSNRLVRLGGVVVVLVIVAGLLVAGGIYLGYLPNPLGGGPEMSFTGNEAGNLVTVEISGAAANAPLLLRVDGTERTSVTTNGSGFATTTLRLPSGNHSVALVDDSSTQASPSPTATTAATATSSGGNDVLLEREVSVTPGININVGEQEQELVTDESISRTVTSSPVSVRPSNSEATMLIDGNEESPGMLNLPEGEYNVTATRPDGNTTQVVSGTVVVDYNNTAAIQASGTRDNVVWVNGSTNASSVTIEAVPTGEGDTITRTRSKRTNVSGFNESLALPVESGTWEITASTNGETLATGTVEVSTPITSFEVGGSPYEPGGEVSGEVTLNGTVDPSPRNVRAEPGGNVTVENGEFTGLAIQSGATTVVVTGENSAGAVFVVELNLTRSSGGQASLQTDRSDPGARTTAVATRSLVPPRAARSAI